MNNFLFSAVKVGMIQKGLLEDEDHLSQERLQVTKRLKDYKDAKEYLNYSAGSFALIFAQEAVGLLKYKNGDIEIVRLESQDVKQEFEQFKAVFPSIEKLEKQVDKGKE